MKHTYMAMILTLISAMAFGASQQDVLKQKLSGRTGEASEDQRIRDLLGCKGNTFSAGVTITAVNVTINGDIADVYADYSGKYTRQGWQYPCVHGGHEDRNINGKAHFTVKQVDFGTPEVSWLGITDLGEVNDAGHDSNIFASRAVKSAISSGGIPVP